MARFGFSRGDFALTRFLLTLAVVGAPFAVLSPLLDWWRGEPLYWEGNTGMGGGRALPLLQARRGAHVSWPGDAGVSLTHASTGLWLATLVPVALGALTVMGVGIGLLRLLTVVRRGEPFVPAMVTTLRLIGVLVMVGTVATSVTTDLVGNAVMSAAIVDGSQVYELLNTPMLLALVTGLVLAVLAEAFAHGARMAEDLEGVV